MGAKTWMVVYSNGDVPAVWNKKPSIKDDRNAEILRTLFPNKKFNAIEDGNLAFAYPDGSNIQTINSLMFLQCIVSLIGLPLQYGKLIR